MSVYIEYPDYYLLDSTYIPKDPQNRLYRKLQSEVQQGTSSIVAYDGSAAEIEQLRQDKLDELLLEAESRMRASVPGIDSFETFELIREMFLSIAPAARQPTAAFQSVFDIYQAGKSARATIKGFTTKAQITAYDVTTDPSWP